MADSYTDDYTGAYGSTGITVSGTNVQVSNPNRTVTAVLGAGVGAGIATTVAGSIGSSTTGPVSYPSLAVARSLLNTPSDANYVTWPGALTDSPSLMLEEVFMSLGNNDILVLPERGSSYLIDSADGFRAAGVNWVTNNGTIEPIVNQYKGSAARTWFSMTRSRRGILGLGPGAVIEPSPSSFSRIRQGYPAQSTYHTTGGATNTITGCQEALIESDSPVVNPYFGNFTLKSRSFGGVAYSGLRAKGGLITYEKIKGQGFWEAFDREPNGETSGLQVNSGTYLIVDCELDGRDSVTLTGRCASPVMLSSCTSGHMRNVWAHHCTFIRYPGGLGPAQPNPYGGGPAWWNCTGTHLIEDCTLEKPGGFNLEINGDAAGAFLFDWRRGTIDASYPDGTLGTHFSVRSPNHSQVMSYANVALLGGISGASLTANGYVGGGETQHQLKSDITATNPGGGAITVVTYNF